MFAALGPAAQGWGGTSYQKQRRRGEPHSRRYNAAVHRLYLLRHGKSDWSADFAGDAARPLAPRGVEDARRMGAALTRLGEVPDRVLTSPAVRARDTARLAAEAGQWGCPLEEAPELYDATPQAVIGRLAQVGDAPRLLVVGHQPCWSALVEGLGGGRVEMPTAALVRLDCSLEAWSALGPGGATLRWLLTPKLLARLGRR